jgi:tripeptide aminopeptidase
MLINRERLAQTFTTLCEIESPSRHEGGVADYLVDEFKKLGADSIATDDSATQTGSDTGNLIARFSGSSSQEDSVFFACHMDTVGPTSGVKVERIGDIFTSQGDTILGGDDKSGIAVLLELMTILRENSIPHSPVELVFTTCEEIGLLGAKALNRTLLESKYGYALDSSSSDKVITGAPAANSLDISIFGSAAHSGLSPEFGINALSIAAEAISKTKMGRLDELSTANLGLIQGGTATNIVPELVKIKGEVRSHSTHSLERYTNEIRDVFNETANNWPECEDGSGKRPSVLFEAEEEFPAMSLSDEDPVLAKIKAAAEKIGQQLTFDIAGGGSDANIFCSYGIKTAILPTGMAKVHTTDEQIDLDDMVHLAELILAMVRKDST